MSKWLPRVPNPDCQNERSSFAASRGCARIRVPAIWASEFSQSFNPGKAALIEIQKIVERRVEEGLAASADYKRRKMEEQATRCWAAAEALNELAKDIARKTGKGLPAHNGRTEVSQEAEKL